MKLKEIYSAGLALNKVMSMHFSSFKLKRELVKFSKRVNEESEFFVNNNRELIMKYAMKKEDGSPDILANGQIKFENRENLQAYEAEINELNNTEIDDIQPFKIKISDVDEKDMNSLTPNELLALESLIIFEEE